MLDIEALWDYNDPAASELRFREALETITDPGDRAEIQTQLARTLSLRRRIDEAHALLDEVESDLTELGPRPRVRYLLERGRTFNTANQAPKARPLFEQACSLGLAAHEDFLAADAAHMVAYISDGQEALDWNIQTAEIARASTDPAAKKWIATAANNSGWSYFGSDRLEQALEQFELALEARQGGPLERILIARWCVARTYRALGRLDEALALQRELEAEREKLGQPGGFVFEEIAECLHALGRTEEARPFFARAHELLSQDPWLASDEPARLERLAALANP